MLKKLIMMAVAATLTLTAGAPRAAAQNDERPANYAKRERFKALIYYSPDVEIAHRQFSEQTVEFFKKLNYGEGFVLDVATSDDVFDYDNLKQYSVVIMPDAYPMDAKGRAAFEKYMENGGGWIGFHAAGYNDSSTGWPWYNKFLGCGTFLCNNWPPQPVLVATEGASDHAVTRSLPGEFVVPSSEWYQWSPSAADNPDVEVLLSISPKNYPLGLKDIIYGGKLPIVWTNRDYRMIYLNMGHGDEEFEDPTQKLLFVNAFRWIVSRDPSGNPFDR